MAHRMAMNLHKNYQWVTAVRPIIVDYSENYIKPIKLRVKWRVFQRRNSYTIRVE